MRTQWTSILLAIGVVGTALTSNQAAAPATPQQLITGKAYLNITGTAVANLTNNAKFPNSPDQVLFFPYFEFNAGGDISVAAANYGDNYGGQMVGYFYPPTTGDYVFYIAADDNAVLYLSPTANAADKKVIARETAWSNAREFSGSSGGNSDLNAKDSSLYTATEWATIDPGLGGAKITLTAGQAYYIEALFKEGTGGDRLAVAVADPTFTIDPSLPIPGQYLSTDRTSGPASIVTQPASQTVAERGSVTFSVLADGTPPYTYQWRSNGVDIVDATGLNYTISPVPFSANASTYSVVVTGAEGTPVTSGNATLTVTPDTTLPTVLSAKGSPNRTEVVVTFSEPIDPVTGAQTGNYQISSAGGALNVTGATVSASGTQVTLTTAQQTLGTKYTLLVNGVRDTAATPNTIAADSRAVFIPTGRIIESNGLVVIEAENWDRNTDDIWVRDTTRGVPSGGASVVAPNGAGGSVNSRLEYDVDFAQAATYTVWIRASGDNGNDDSVWFYMDNGFGTIEAPFGRELSNDASMTGFQPQADFVWRSDAQSGADPFTIDIPATGVRTIALARREDGSFVDKIIITTIPGYSPTGFGPPETREGAPGLPTVAITAPTTGQTFAAGGNINVTVNAAGQAGLNITRVQYTANGNVIGESTTSPFNFTWNNVAAGIYGIRATAYDEIGQANTSDSVAVTVGTPPPQALLVVGTDSNPNLNPSDAAIKARVEAQGWQVTVEQAPASTTASADGKQLIIISSTVNSGDVLAKFKDVTVPAIMWEQAVQDDFGMTGNVDGTDRGTQTGQTQINIVNNTHPLAAGLPLGLLTVVSNAQDFAYGAPSANAVVIAQMADNPARAVVYGYDTGALMADGTPAPARRVMLFPSNNAYVQFTPEAVQIFDAAVQWASGITPPPPGAKIAWISFHPADNDPWTAAETAGFTNAPDVGYTALLREAGHDVTRFRTTGTPDTNVLNTFDLVIISRSVPSGDYQDPPETALWNGITAPTMILGGYLTRQNRLGFMAGSTIPDTAGPVKLTVNDANHPIFEGISLDGTGTMVNDYAVIATYTNQPQRGISVVTGDTSAGATILATVGTAGDPAVGGLVIGEWKAGSVLANGSANVLAGDRLVFLTGSRESSTPALTSEGAGIYDLTADGAKMFLNAVNYMAGLTDPGPDAPSIAIGRNASGQIVITFEGTLQSTTSLAPPRTWATEAGTGTVVVDPSLPMKFYRSTR